MASGHARLYFVCVSVSHAHARARAHTHMHMHMHTHTCTHRQRAPPRALKLLLALLRRLPPVLFSARCITSRVARLYVPKVSAALTSARCVA